MIRFFFLSLLYILGAAGLFLWWLMHLEQWYWLVATLLWAIIAGGFLFGQSQDALSRSEDE